MKKPLTLAALLYASSFNLCYEAIPKLHTAVVITKPVNQTPLTELPRLSKDELLIRYFSSKIDENLLRMIAKTAKTYNIPLDVAFTFVATESEFKVRAVSRAGAKSGRGLLQVSEVALKEYNNWHKACERITKQKLLSAPENLEVGFWYLAFIKNKLKTNTWSHVYMAYNVGMRDFKRQKDLLLSGRYRTKSGKIVAYGALNRFQRMALVYNYNATNVKVAKN